MLDIMGTVLSFAGIYLNAKKIIYCWHVWVVSNVIWILYCIKTREYVTMIMWSGFILANIYGYLQWKKKIKK